MNKHRIKGRYTKGGFKLDQNLILLASLAAFILAYYFGSLNDNAAGVRFDHLKNTDLPLSAEKKAELSHLSQQDKIDADLRGTYAYLVDYGSGMMLRGDVSIDDESISRSISINHYSMFASANYEVVGSTVQYSDVTGDQYLFSEYGTAMGDDAKYGKYLEIDGDTKLFIETKYTQDDYKPLSKALDISIFQRFKMMSVWALLQTFFGLTGVGILLYILVRLIEQSRRKPKNPKDDILTA